MTGARGWGLGAGLVAGLRVWTGQSGVLAPWGVIAIATRGPLGYLTSTCDVGVNVLLKLFTFSFFFVGGLLGPDG